MTEWRLDASVVKSFGNVFLSRYRLPGRLPRFKEDTGVHRHSAIAMVEDHERIYFNRGDFGKVLYER